MMVSGLLGHIDESMDDGVVDEASPAIVLQRNVGVDLSCDNAWREIPVLGVELDGNECDLMVGPLENGSPLTVSTLRSALESLGPGAADFHLFVRGNSTKLGKGWVIRTDVPIIAAVCNAERRIFAVMPSYEGYEDEFGN